MNVVPELLVTDINASMTFWRDLIGFSIKYERPEDKFVFLALEGAEIMLEQIGEGRNWITGELSKPFGRGVNFQISVSDFDASLQRLRDARYDLYMKPETKWYRMNNEEVGQSQFLVQDPDGYLLRICQSLGRRAAA